MLLSIRRAADIARAKFVFVHTFPLKPITKPPHTLNTLAEGLAYKLCGKN
jgi:hypothetical protein